MQMVVKATLEDNTTLSLKAIEGRDSVGMVALEDGHTLTGGYRLYKLKGNVLCGEEVQYKALDIHIEK